MDGNAFSTIDLFPLIVEHRHFLKYASAVDIKIGTKLAVYTSLDQDDMLALLADYDLGNLVSFQGISGGVENTNYFVTTDQGKYVLTLFEEFEAEEVPYFLDVVAHFKAEGFNVPAAINDKQGERLRMIKDRPAIMVDCFPGTLLDQTDVASCALMGTELAKLHKSGQMFPEKRPSHRGVEWWNTTSKALAPKLPAEDATLLLSQVEAFDDFLQTSTELPTGTIHADLFFNNTLFVGTELSAIIDFYNACHSWLTYDLAIVVNDWCSDPETGEIELEKYRSLITAYANERAFTEAEKDNWPLMLQTAAMRFWLSRLEAWYGAIDDPERLAQQHNPEEIKRILNARVKFCPALVG